MLENSKTYWDDEYWKDKIKNSQTDFITDN